MFSLDFEMSFSTLRKFFAINLNGRHSLDRQHRGLTLKTYDGVVNKAWSISDEDKAQFLTDVIDCVISVPHSSVTSFLVEVAVDPYFYHVFRLMAPVTDAQPRIGCSMRER